MSAVWRIGYASSPRLSRLSDTSSSELAFRETASLDLKKQHNLSISCQKVDNSPHTFHVVILCSFPMGVMQLRIQASSACSGTWSRRLATLARSEVGFAYLILKKQNGSLGVYSDGEQTSQPVQAVFMKSLRVLGHRNRMIAYS